MSVRMRVSLLSGALLFLGACATQPSVNEAPLDPARAREILAQLDDWKFDGRVAVAAGDEGFNASLAWTQTGAESAVRLASPLGAGTLRLQFGVQPLRVLSSRGQDLEGAEALAAVQAQLGFEPPLDSLRYWLLGMPAPGSQALEERGPEGNLHSLTQGGWRVEYLEYGTRRSPSGLLTVPVRMRATREDLRLRVVMDRWWLDQ